MDFSRTWTQFAADAEVEHYGTQRLCTAHNKLKAELAEVKAQRDRLLTDATRYQWLRDNGHLNSWWSVQGPADRCANIDEDIDTAIAEIESTKEKP